MAIQQKASRMQSTSNRNTAGFTLIEMLVIAPLVLLLIGGIVALMVSLLGDVHISTERNRSIADLQGALDSIERDVTIGFSLNQTSGTLPDKQGVNDGTGAFTKDSALIIAQRATIKNPYASDRALAYLTAPAACGSTNQYLNTIVTAQIIYFVKDSALYRRTSIPLAHAGANSVCGPGATTTSVWQKNSCAVIGSAAHCLSKDEKLVEGVTSFVLQYDNPATPTSVRVTLSVSNSVAGASYTNNGSIRADTTNN